MQQIKNIFGKKRTHFSFVAIEISSSRFTEDQATPHNIVIRVCTYDLSLKKRIENAALNIDLTPRPIHISGLFVFLASDILWIKILHHICTAELFESIIRIHRKTGVNVVALV